MSRNSKNSSKTGAKSKGIKQPFKESVLRKGRKIVEDYRIILERNEKLGFIGSSVELPTVFADAKTPEKCYKASQEALIIAVATMIECGQRPPQPSSARMRTEQVNVRLTAEEKLLFGNAAMNLGFKAYLILFATRPSTAFSPSAKLIMLFNRRSQY